MKACIIDRDYLPEAVPCPFKRQDFALCLLCNREKGNPDEQAEDKVMGELVEDKLRERDMRNASRCVLTASYDYVFSSNLSTN